jgi:hypothetical protein
MTRIFRLYNSHFQLARQREDNSDHDLQVLLRLEEDDTDCRLYEDFRKYGTIGCTRTVGCTRTKGCTRTIAFTRTILYVVQGQ